ncbi:von Willebrand factor type A [Oscillochloris trichoides DG-6]|uniref:von Willebrand factor type A n=1 Tax=Oscillochloris trichoides DG-6 TaxID=765420 RepID=E1IG33_9CHLR|nr:VWA domain-containing protein [Oscillochloris trichoides]EFO79850.1 von Willebrand factor type A [Oscillochloris trichoides DG-6]
MRRTSFLLLIVIVTSLLAACGDTNTSGPSANALRISIAYSPEKEAWLTERIAIFNSQNQRIGDRPIFVEGINKSSGAARTEIKNDTLQVTVWSPSASTWLEVLRQETSNQGVAVSNEPLVLTPVVIGMWQPMAEALGWPNTPIGWSDMLELINNPEGWGAYGHPEWGRFSWGHTDPEISTTALSTLIAEFYAATNKQKGLTSADVQSETSQQFIRDLGQGIKHYGYNTLVFSQNMKKFGMSYISAFPMEEITLIDFNKVNPPPTPLVAIYPEEGTFWHDNPYIVMASATPEEQQAAKVFYDFLLNEESQRLAMNYGFRPANVSVPLADPISMAYGVQPQGVQTILEVPKADVIVAVKNSWAINRKRADIILVVDISGSMEGDKLEMTRAGLESFLMRILPDDRVGMITFSSSATEVVAPAALSENRMQLQMAISEMSATGKTAVFDAVELARQSLEALPSTGEDRMKAIVLLSDGADNASRITLADLERNFDETGVSIFPVAYGADADRSILDAIAEFSRTIVVVGDTGDIAQIFENLSRYF